MLGYGLGYDPAAPPAEMAATAVEAEAAGFDLVFFSETLFANRDAVSCLATFAAKTKSAKLGATQIAGLRSPLVMAQTLATLDELSDGRIIVAFGACTQKHAKRHGVRCDEPTTILREYVEVIRRLLSGERVSYKGDTVAMEDSGLGFVPPRDDLPIWIAATSRKGLRNAAKIGDGILLDAGASPSYSANAIDIVAQECQEMGRSFEDLTIAQLINTSVAENRNDAIERMRWEVASKFIFPSTPKVKLAVGEPVVDPSDLERLRAAYKNGGLNALAAALPIEYVTGLTATGTEDDVQAAVARYRDAGVDMPILREASSGSRSGGIRRLAHLGKATSGPVDRLIPPS